MILELTRPLCFIDIESTGLNRETDRIVELSICKLDPSGEKTVKTRRFNPTIPISVGSTDVHGIKDEDVINEPTFSKLAASLFFFIENCDMAGFGSNHFDIPMLYNEFMRAGITWDYSTVNMVDVGNIFKIQEPRDLTASLSFYCDQEHSGAHGANADVMATLSVFGAQLNKYPELPKTIEELAVFSNYGNKILDLSGKFTYNESGDIIFNFGPKRGEKASDHVDFLYWMISKDFAPDTLKICSDLINNPVFE